MGTKTPLIARVWSWQTAPRWERRPLAARVAPAEANHARSLQPAVAAVKQAVVTVPAQVVQAGLEVENEVEDDDGDGDDPNKRRKTGGEGEPPKQLVARKEPRKAGTVYPPIDRKLPVLYISRPKERTILGHRVLDWTEEQKRKIHEAGCRGGW